MPKYVVICWRNDGDYHDENYTLHPMFAFEAEDDAAAKRSIVLYIEKNRIKGEDFWLETLVRIERPITVKQVPVANHERFSDDKDFVPVLITPKTQEILKKAGFKKLKINKDLLKILG